ncbi:hypothetical protein CBR_g39600 [Chara braunii]|uniref:Uncharacterized protein n=1 Tax=Chara braunii TaxID=69332 RepID=A0A388K1A0_CHABU|nr:hypothetical protein CBR_g39600 [Chara braunii]|eukprot:GBG63816.1 hypothetical protein CBR_g39600 [Chara braunii]
MRVLSLRWQEGAEIEVGAISMAEWFDDMSRDMLDVIWELEEGPDPQLEAFIDWRHEDDSIGVCKALFAQGCHLHDQLKGRSWTRDDEYPSPDRQERGKTTADWLSSKGEEETAAAQAATETTAATATTTSTITSATSIKTTMTAMVTMAASAVIPAQHGELAGSVDDNSGNNKDNSGNISNNNNSADGAGSGDGNDGNINDNNSDSNDNSSDINSNNVGDDNGCCYPSPLLCVVSS